MAKILQIDVSQHQGRVPVTVFQVRGDIDASSYEQLQSEAGRAIEAGTRNLALDLEQVSYISSAGLRAIHTISNKLASANEGAAPRGMYGGTFKSPYLKLLKPSAEIRETLQVMGFDMFLEIYSNLNEAIASFFHLTETLKQALRAPGPEAEAQRLDLLRGRRILLVMGGYPGKRPVYERARELGVKLVVLDGPGHWTQAAVQEGLFEGFIEVELFPSESLADRAFAAIKASGLQFDGISTVWDLAGPLTALLAQGLGLPGHPLLPVSYSRNKIFTREVCLEAGIPSPRFFRIKSAADLERAAAHVGFPAVLKPVFGTASVATYYVDNEQTLRQRYMDTLNSLQGGPKTGSGQSDDWRLKQIWVEGAVMTLEEFLDGEEFDVDCLMSEGELVYAGVVYNLPQPHCKEVGSKIPPPFPVDMQAELVELTHRCLRALGFSDGVFHVELKYTSAGARLLEVNARLGGGFNYQMNKMVWGVDLVEQYLLTCLGLPIRPQKAPQPLLCVAESDLPCPYSGVILHANFLAEVAADPHVLLCKTHVTAGQRVIGPEEDVPDWLGEVVVGGKTIEEAGRTLDELIGRVEFPIQRDGEPSE